MLTERQAEILTAIVDEYIQSAFPVSSGAIFDTGKFDVSCPTIRNEMSHLTEEGYLHQPHTSAGRVPTEQGYRFFVDMLLKGRHADNKVWQGSRRTKEVKFLVREIAANSSDLVLFVDQNGELRYEGLKKVLTKPEFEDKEAVISLIDELENLTISYETMMTEFENEIEVFVGSENPFFKNVEYSLMALGLGNGFIGIVGPMRMHYERNMRLLDTLL
ncbi:MAG: hypothetical protein HYS15_02355 [Candidatus Spechtbacteria bacterium]|nr:hypothetical protein [Candidatus Spechtbacteria bacterium]